MKYLVTWPASSPLLLGWIAFFVVFPFYTFDSGLPQIADLLMAVLIAYVVLSKVTSGTVELRSVLRPLFFLVIYSFAVTAASIPFIDVEGLGATLQFLFPVFYLYNFLAVVVALDFYQRFGRRFLEATFVGIFLSLMLQAVLLPVGVSGATRSSLFFNNPNQLGYYILLIMTLFFYLDRTLKPPMLLKVVVVIFGFAIAYVSLSKAAIISSGILVGINLADAGVKRPKQLIGGVLAITVLLVGILGTSLGGQVLKNTTDQLSTIGQGSDESLSGRGYDRITNYPYFLVMGAGEGGYARFYEDKERHYELHSSFGTLLFSYGLPGSFAFLLFVVRTFRGSSFVEMLYAVPVFAYGVTHMGLRFTLFWIFFAIVASFNDFKKRDSRRRIAVTPGNRTRFVRRRRRRVTQIRPCIVGDHA